MKLSAILAGVALASAAPASQAAVLFTLASPTVELESPGEVTETFSSAGGAGEVSFRIDAFGSLDGANLANGNSDTFTLSLNGVDILSGSWDLGGGGDNVVFFAPAGSTIEAHSPPGFSDGGTLKVTTSLSLAAGVNSLKFAFATDNPKGLSDEGWKLTAASVTGAPASSGVPEPASWALMLGGFFVAGTTVRGARRRASA